MMPSMPFIQATARDIERAFSARLTKRTASVQTPAERFMDTFNRNTSPAGLGRKGRFLRTEDQGFVLVGITDRTNFMPRGTDHLFIEQFRCETPGRGHGSKAMALITQWADAEKVNLGIFAQPAADTTIKDKALNEEQLVKWLESHRFEAYNVPATLHWRDPQPAL